jgi:putative transcriptional regulator
MIVDDEDFAGIISGLNDVKDYYAGKREGFVAHEPVDVKAVRAVTKLSQARFAEVYHLPLPTVKGWEQNRRAPDQPARILLQMIATDPTGVAKMIERIAQPA